jgi:hypothetical protein
MAYLQFIADSKLLAAVTKVIRKIESAQGDVDLKLYKNVLDPFSALFDGLTHNMSYDDWISSEKMRQIQKTMQNAIGDFHQDLLGGISGCENLGVGGGVDICNRGKKIIAEIKNKFNTTKGNHKVEIYDAIRGKLKKPEFTGFVGYYAEIIPQNKKVYNKPFVPSDSKTKRKRPANQSIRLIDGKSFYTLMTGNPSALQQLFEVLPQVISDHFPYSWNKVEEEKYLELFARAFDVP